MKTPLLILVLAAPFAATAQNPPPGPPPDPLGRAIDRDGDHRISAREIRRAPKSLLKLDRDRDGALSSAELRPEAPADRTPRDGEAGEAPQGPPPSPFLGALDTDRSGELSAAEIEAASASLAKLDRDDDGELSPEELGLPTPGGRDPGPPAAPPGPARR